jgi:two-component system nitrogen regulation sensor histidine kinase NtrY
MKPVSLSSAMDALDAQRLRPGFQTAITIIIVALGPILAVGTLLVVNVFERQPISASFRLIMLADLIYVLIIAALVIRRVAKVIAARRAQSAGSRLHLRLTGVFALVALIPTVLVAVFAMFTVNFGLEGWFSDRVSDVVGSSLNAAQAYESEHERGLRQDAFVFASQIDLQFAQNSFVNDAQLRDWVSTIQGQIQRGFREAFIIDGTGDLLLRGDRSYSFDFEHPAPTHIETVRDEGISIIKDWNNNEFRAIVNLSSYADRFLYVTRVVDGSILNLLDDTEETIQLYQQLENERGTILLDFALIYLAFAVLLLLAAVWVGLWFAERLSRPVGQLAGAAQRVGAGDLDIRVPDEKDDDEIAMLGRVFNQMTKQLKGQRDALISANEHSESARRRFDSVLSGVTTGVVGLNSDGELDFMNRAAIGILELDVIEDQGKALGLAVPEFAPLISRIQQDGTSVVRKEIKMSRHGKLENLLARIAARRGPENVVEGYVVTFDDVTDLVTAQRMAAWGDVARRIAHEIKNPLTPIQLSAERLKRKFAPLVGDQAEVLTQYTDVIVRQTGDLRRIVDEFSKFARMPEPERRQNDLVSVLKDAIILQENRTPEIKISSQISSETIVFEFDKTMIGQALTNLIKNAGEAIEGYIEKNPDLKAFKPELRIDQTIHDNSVVLTVCDNGIGLPEDRNRLFEPYVTTRAKGTGLGLPIVKKIIEEHGGTLSLTDAPIFEGNDHMGAMAEVTLPMTYSIKQGIDTQQVA